MSSETNNACFILFKCAETRKHVILKC